MIPTIRQSFEEVLPEVLVNLARRPDDGSAVPAAIAEASVAINNMRVANTNLDSRVEQLESQRAALTGAQQNTDDLCAATMTELFGLQGAAKGVGKGWLLQMGVLTCLVLLAVVFGALLVPTLETLVFTDMATKEAVPHAAAMSWGAGMFIGLVLAFTSFIVSSKPTNNDPFDDTMETIHNLSPLFLGLNMVASIALLRGAQMGWKPEVLGLSVFELVIVGMIQMLAMYHKRTFARRKEGYPAQIAQLAASRARRWSDFGQMLEIKAVEIRKVQVLRALCAIPGEGTTEEQQKKMGNTLRSVFEAYHRDVHGQAGK